VPNAEAAISSDSLRGSAAVQLFAQRGQAISPSFAVTDGNAPLVVEICRRLDGVPLAIELAASRVTHLSLPMLWERLDRRLPLLTGGGRDRPLRLQTMRDAIAWSYQLLDVDEQALFRRLAVFAGGFTLDVAERVSAGAEGTFDAIAALVDASLLQAEAVQDGTTRYRMLETIREFALESLRASAEEETVRDRHAAAYIDFAVRYEFTEMLPNSDQILALLDAEHANLRVALAWLEERGEAGPFLKLAAALGHFWTGQGHYQEGRDWLERALAQGGHPAPEDRAKSLVVLGLIQIYQGANQEAEGTLAEGLAASRELGDALHEAIALIGLGGLATLRGDLGRSAKLLEEARAVAETVADRRLAGILTGWVANNLAVIARAQGDYALAASRLDESLRLEREAASTDGVIMALGDLGDLARDQGDHVRALGYYREALALGRVNPGQRVVTEVVEAAGIVAVALGKAEQGVRLMSAAAAQRERLRLRYRVRGTVVALEQALATARAALGEDAFAAAWAAGQTLGPRQAVAEALDPVVAPAGDAGGSLTPREAEVLHLLGSGMTDPAIAAALFISVRTVENHVARIFAKLGVRTRTAAVSAAISSGLIEPTRSSSA
jgi:non-specific serine/threonine protein kinase